jgi:hypothetical protein
MEISHQNKWRLQSMEQSSIMSPFNINYRRLGISGQVILKE